MKRVEKYVDIHFYWDKITATDLRIRSRWKYHGALGVMKTHVFRANVSKFVEKKIVENVCIRALHGGGGKKEDKKNNNNNIITLHFFVVP